MKILLALLICFPNIIFPQTGFQFDLDNDGIIERGNIVLLPNECTEETGIENARDHVREYARVAENARPTKNAGTAENTGTTEYAGTAENTDPTENARPTKNAGTAENTGTTEYARTAENTGTTEYVRTAVIFSGENEIFKSDPCWDVHEILAGDFNNDGENEIALLLWKKGNYGKSMPFWETENSDEVRMHFFLYKMNHKSDASLADKNPTRGLKPIWQSSNLPYENLRTRLINFDRNGQSDQNESNIRSKQSNKSGEGDLNNKNTQNSRSGRNEIFVIQRTYTTPHEYSLAIWRWGIWGFELQNRL